MVSRVFSKEAEGTGLATPITAPTDTEKDGATKQQTAPLAIGLVQ